MAERARTQPEFTPFPLQWILRRLRFYPRATRPRIAEPQLQLRSLRKLDSTASPIPPEEDFGKLLKILTDQLIHPTGAFFLSHSLKRKSGGKT